MRCRATQNANLWGGDSRSANRSTLEPFFVKCSVDPRDRSNAISNGIFAQDERIFAHAAPPPAFGRRTSGGNRRETRLSEHA